MTKKKGSKLLTRQTRSNIGRKASAYSAPNWHLCQNYAENGSFLTVHKNIKASIHKNAQQSTIMECNLYRTNAIVTDWLQLLSNPLQLFRGLNDCKDYLFHPR